jgi:hypothetical protein
MIFIKNLELADPPWQILDREQGIVVDRRGRLVAVIPLSPPEIRADATRKISSSQAVTVPLPEGMPEPNHSANLHLIAAAPELLAALKEAAYHLDVAGIPLNSAYYELIQRAENQTHPMMPVTDRRTTQ